MDLSKMLAITEVSTTESTEAIGARRRPRAPTIDIDESAVNMIRASEEEEAHTVRLQAEGLMTQPGTSYLTASPTDTQTPPADRYSRPTTPHNISSPTYRFPDGAGAQSFLSVPGARSRGNSLDSEVGGRSSSSYGGDTHIPSLNTGSSFRLGPDPFDLIDALRPDPGCEEDFYVAENRFAFSPGQLNKLVNPKSLAAFHALGGLEGLERGLRTDVRAGLSVDETILEGHVSFEDAIRATWSARLQKLSVADTPTGYGNLTRKSFLDAADSESFRDRKRVFKENRLPIRSLRRLHCRIWNKIEDHILLVLLLATLVCFALDVSHREQFKQMSVGLQETHGGSWQQALAVLVSILAVVMVECGLEWIVEKRALRSEQMRGDRLVKVIRSGRTRQISVFELCVGDVVHLEAGDIVPVDGVFIDGHGIKCDESSVTGDSYLSTKMSATEVMRSIEDGTSLRGLDPFILSGSTVTEGVGVCLVTAVGLHSSLGKILLNIFWKDADTPLMKQVMESVQRVKMGSVVLALICFVALNVRLAVNVCTRDKLLRPAQKAQAFFWNIVTATTIAVIVPSNLIEAVLQCASQIADSRAAKDSHIAKNPIAREKLASVTTFCAHIDNLVQKHCDIVTGWVFSETLPVGFGTLMAKSEKSYDMHSSAASADSGSDSKNFRRVPVSELKGLLKGDIKSLLVESIAVNTTALEVSQLEAPKFVGHKMEIALLNFAKNVLGMEDVNQERAWAKVYSSTNSIPGGLTATLVRRNNGIYRLCVHVHAHALVQYCSHTIGDIRNHSSINAKIIETEATGMTSATALLQSKHSQTLLFVGVAYRDFSNTPSSMLDGGQGSRIEKLMKDMTLVAILGGHSPLRLDASDGILACQEHGLSVRLMCDEDIQYAKGVATECGIFTPGGIAIEGPVFRNLSDTQVVRILPKTQILAAASSLDKQWMVKQLQDQGEIVAMAGGSYKESPSLRASDVGLCLDEAGTEAARESCGILLTNDSISSCVRAIHWGHGITAFVRKNFQLRSAATISAVALVFISAIASTNNESVLSAPQVFWIRLILDTFLAISIIIEIKPEKGLRPERREPVITTCFTWAMMLGQATFQLTALLILYYAGPSIFRYTSNHGLALKTLIFNTFMWMQVLNLLNNRSFTEYNVFKSLHHVIPLAAFIVPSVLVLGFQTIIINYGGTAFGVVRLDGVQWATSIGVAALTLPLGSLIRLVSSDLLVQRFTSRKQDLFRFLCSWGPKENQRRRLRTHQPLAVVAVISSTLAAGIAGIPRYSYTYRRHISIKRVWSMFTWSWVTIAETLHDIALTFYIIYVGGVRSEALADTGAAVNLVSQDFIKRNSGDWLVHDHVHQLTIGNGKTIYSLGNIKTEVRFEDSQVPHVATLHIVDGFPFDVALSHDFLKATETIQFSRPGAIKRAGLYRGDQARPARAVILANLVAVRKPSLTTRLWRCLGRERKVVSTTVDDSPAILDALNLRKGEIDQRELFVTTNRNHLGSPATDVDSTDARPARIDDISFANV